MHMSKPVGTVLLAALLSALSVACGGSGGDASGTDSANFTGSKLNVRQIFDCNEDNDCVAINQVAKCPGGGMVAVRRNQEANYAQLVSQNPNNCVTGDRDTSKVAECNTKTKASVCDMGFGNAGQTPFNPQKQPGEG
jgi:hypothetical protein